MQETQVRSLGKGDPLKKGMATQSSILAWRIPRTEEPGRLQPMGSQRVRQDWVIELNLKYYDYKIIHQLWVKLCPFPNSYA